MLHVCPRISGGRRALAADQISGDEIELRRYRSPPPSPRVRRRDLAAAEIPSNAPAAPTTPAGTGGSSSIMSSRPMKAATSTSFAAFDVVGKLKHAPLSHRRRSATIVICMSRDCRTTCCTMVSEKSRNHGLRAVRRSCSYSNGQNDSGADDVKLRPEGTINVNSWAPDSKRFTYVIYEPLWAGLQSAASQCRFWLLFRRNPLVSRPRTSSASLESAGLPRWTASARLGPRR